MSAADRGRPTVSIAVVGAGDIGRTLGGAWQRAGHTVTFGLRDLEGESARVVRDGFGDDVSIALVPDAIRGAEVALFAIPGATVASVVEENAEALAERVVIDAANDLSGESMSNARLIAARVPSAHVYRAFNSVGWENFAEPRFGGEQADLFYCGPDGSPAETLEGLVADVGLRPVRVGDLDATPIVDNLASLWFALALRQGRGRHLAFKMLT